MSFNALSNIQSHVKFEEPLSVKNSKIVKSKEATERVIDKSYSFSNLNKVPLSQQGKKEKDDKQILIV